MYERMTDTDPVKASRPCSPSHRASQLPAARRIRIVGQREGNHACIENVRGRGGGGHYHGGGQDKRKAARGKEEKHAGVLCSAVSKE